MTNGAKLEMSIHELFDLVEPIQRVIDHQSIQSVIDNVGISLPEDFVQIALSYGLGQFRGRARVQYLCPQVAGYSDYLFEELEGWKRQCEALDFRDLLFYPNENGILPMGNFDNAVRIAFVCGGPPDAWSIMAFDDLDNRHCYQMDSTSFLIKALKGDMPELCCDERDEAKVIDFIPYTNHRYGPQGLVME